MRKTTKDLTLVAIILWIKELPKYLYQQSLLQKSWAEALQNKLKS